MRNRLAIWMTGFAIFEAFLFIGEVSKYIIVYIFNWCLSESDMVCIGKNNFRLFIYSLLVFLIVFFLFEGAIWLIEKRKENNAFDAKEYDSTPYVTAIAIINKSYPIIEDCSVELVRANVLNNRGCRTVFDERMNVEKISKLFIWDNKSTNKDLSKDGFGKIEIALVTKDEKIILLTEKEIAYFPVFPNRKNGSLAKKATYQIEIKVSGKVNSDGVDRIVKGSTFWEIDYKYKRDHYNSQNIWIKKIEKLQDTNNFSLGKPVSAVSKFILKMDKDL